jgi:hypothetical protein
MYVWPEAPFFVMAAFFHANHYAFVEPEITAILDSITVN